MSKTEEPTGSSPQKKALAAVLVVIFVVVLVVQFGTASNTQGANRKKVAGNAAARDTPSKRSQEPVGLDATERPIVLWPKRELADVLLHDPFALPKTFVAQQSKSPSTTKPGLQQEGEDLLKKRAQWSRVVAQLQQQGVKAVFSGSDVGNVAIVGSQTVRVGDELNGIRVIAIEADGIVLAQAPRE